MSPIIEAAKRRKIVKITLIVVAVLVVARLILPYVVLHYANKTLANMKGYYGHISDIDLALIRGAYVIDSIYINKLDSTTQKQTPFIGARAIDLSVEWKALFHGSLVGELVIDQPSVRFTKDKSEPKQVQKDTAQFDQVLDNFMPLQINRVEVNGGIIQYVDNTSTPRVDISMTHTNVLATNLRNSYDSSILLPSSIRATADVYEGTFAFNMKLNPLSKEPAFDVNAEIKNTNLVKLNDFFQAYVNVDVNRGRFGLYAEAATKDERFSGYVKPLVQDLDVLGKEDHTDNIFRKIWEGIVGAGAEVLQNQKKDQVATKIPFEGTLKNPDSNIWYAVGRVLQNAFVEAIQPSIDHEINITSVDAPKKEEKKTFLQKIFGKKDKKKKNKDKDKEKAKG